jgi:hypothetical protein
MGHNKELVESSNLVPVLDNTKELALGSTKVLARSRRNYTTGHQRRH